MLFFEGMDTFNLIKIFVLFAGCHHGSPVSAQASLLCVSSAYTDGKACCSPTTCICGRTQVFHHHHLNATNQEDCDPNSWSVLRGSKAFAWTVSTADVCSASVRNEDKNCPEKTVQRLLLCLAQRKTTCIL